MDEYFISVQTKEIPWKMWLTLQIAIWYVSVVWANPDLETDLYVNKTLSSLCPYMDFCHRKASKVLDDDDRIPCCSPCSCDDDCFEFENCCPDKIIRDPQARPLSCKRSEVKGLGSVTYTPNSPMYRVVDTCPVDERNLTLIKKCRGENRTDIKDYQWVSDNTTGRIFQNHHCSRCHNYNHVEVWNIRTACTSALLSDFKSFADILLNSDDCNIINDVPDTFETLVRKYECIGSPGGSICNETWANMTHIDACDRYWLPYHLDRTSFKNVYCFMCSRFFGGMSVPEVIEKRDYDTEKTSNTFSLVLNFRTLKYDNDYEAFVCDIDELFDRRLVSQRQFSVVNNSDLD